jgi:CubicO group peptidase (beta-lactamase class C family)
MSMPPLSRFARTDGTAATGRLLAARLHPEPGPASRCDDPAVETILPAFSGDWGASAVGIAVVGPDGQLATSGDTALALPWASVTKLVTALAVLRAVEDGSIALDEPAGPPGATVRHLLAHASGLGFEGPAPISRPERTRIYSNTGFDLLGDLLAERAGRPIGDVLHTAVLAPLGMTGTTLAGRPSAGLVGPLADLAALAGELLRPSFLGPTTFADATAVAFPGLAGVLPGVGRFDPLDWGLGFELRDGKAPHWTGTRNSPRTFGHFGGSGTFLWVDPDADLALACLSDRPFGPWALQAWPALSDAVLAAPR